MGWKSALIGFGGSLLGGRRARRNAKSDRRSNEMLAREERAWQDKNYLQSLNSQLGSDNVDSKDPNNISIYDGKGSDLLGRDRDLEYTGKNIDVMFDKMGEKGLTPQEIAGSPVPGGAKMSGGNNVLGNAETAASSNKARTSAALTSQLINSKTQLATAKIGADSRIKAEAIKAGVALTGQQVSASTARYVADLSSKTGKFNTGQTTQATRDAAKIYADASMHSTDTQRKNVLSQLAVTQKLNDQQIAKMSAQIALIKQDTSFEEVIHSERWQKLFSSMSAENVLASVLAVKNGINIQDVLKGTKVKDREILMNFMHDISASKSAIRRETMGTIKTGTDALSKLNVLIMNLLTGDRAMQQKLQKNYENIGNK